MTVETLPDVVAFQRAYVELLDGDIMAALMLSQIYYWYQPAKSGGSKLRVFRCGKWWLAKSNVDWQKEIGLTPKQARRCVQVLVDKGILVAEVMRFDGSPTTHCRLASVDGRQVLTEPLGVFHLSFGNFPFALQGNSLTETTTETTTKTLKEASQKPDAKAEDENLNIQQALESVKNKKPKTKATPSSLAFLWKKLIGTMTGSFVKEPTSKDMGQFKLLVKAVGEQAPEVVEWAVTNWNDFAWEVAQKKGVKQTPSSPVLGFLLQYHDVAVQLLAKPAAKPQPKVEVPTLAQPKATIKKVADDSLPKAGKDDIAETLALLDQLSNG